MDEHEELEQRVQALTEKSRSWIGLSTGYGASSKCW